MTELADVQDLGAVTSVQVPAPFPTPAISKTEYAPVMELVDMRDLGSRAHALGFESPCPHQITSCIFVLENAAFGISETKIIAKRGA